jgi:hypothetical protein
VSKKIGKKHIKHTPKEQEDEMKGLSHKAFGK